MNYVIREYKIMELCVICVCFQGNIFWGKVILAGVKNDKKLIKDRKIILELAKMIAKQDFHHLF